MPLLLSRNSILDRMGGYRAGARGLIHHAHASLSKDLRVTRSAEVTLSAFTFGVLQGRWKDKGGLTAFALPIDLLAGATFHILGLLPFAHPYAHHLHNLGDGALASFFTTTGYRVGERWSKSGSLRTGVSGIFGDAEQPVAGGSSMADQELASLVKAG
jgi:hypothetical protein